MHLAALKEMKLDKQILSGCYPFPAVNSIGQTDHTFSSRKKILWLAHFIVTSEAAKKRHANGKKKLPYRFKQALLNAEQRALPITVERILFAEIGSSMIWILGTSGNSIIGKNTMSHWQQTNEYSSMI